MKSLIAITLLLIGCILLFNDNTATAITSGNSNTAAHTVKTSRRVKDTQQNKSTVPNDSLHSTPEAQGKSVSIQQSGRHNKVTLSTRGKNGTIAVRQQGSQNHAAVNWFSDSSTASQVNLDQRGSRNAIHLDNPLDRQSELNIHQVGTQQHILLDTAGSDSSTDSTQQVLQVGSDNKNDLKTEKARIHQVGKENSVKNK